MKDIVCNITFFVTKKDIALMIKGSVEKVLNLYGLMLKLKV